MTEFKNPFKPGAGHTPPFLAGRKPEMAEFKKLLKQDTILENLVLTGLRGVGKTVLLESLKPSAIKRGWLWVGTDLSESSSISEINILVRICTDLALVTSGIVVGKHQVDGIGFSAESEESDICLNFDSFMRLADSTPGLIADKLKAILRWAWAGLQAQNTPPKGVIFAYDEAQTLGDQAKKEEYPLSLLLDVFQSLQRSGFPLMLVLTGLPTLFPKLVEARTFSERMFRVIFLKSLKKEDSRKAIQTPIQDSQCPVKLSSDSVDQIIKMAGGYPYFLQFICREVYDAFLQRIARGEPASVPQREIERKLDSDFFAGRWARATDRQRDLLTVIASLGCGDREFTVQEVTKQSTQVGERPFSSSHVNQMLGSLSGQGLVFKNRYGKYSFAVPLLGRFIQRIGDRNAAG